MKTIEEKAEEYAKRREFYLGTGMVSSVGLSWYIKQAYIQGAKDFLSLPIEDRLTEEEKEAIQV